PLRNAPSLPIQIRDPFHVRSGKIGGQLALTIENAKRDGVRVAERACGSQRAGSIQRAAAGQHLEFTFAKKPTPQSTQIPLGFELLLNSALSPESQYGTLVHELAHLYCGHLGTPNDRWWPDRQNLSHTIREFEAESVILCVQPNCRPWTRPSPTVSCVEWPACAKSIVATSFWRAASNMHHKRLLTGNSARPRSRDNCIRK